MDRRAKSTTRDAAHRPGPLRTLIVDDEPLARRGLEMRLAEHADIEIVGQYGDGAARSRACASIART